ncbi:leucine-rich repeat-containing protein 49-like isoform X2 [Oscarella lobularis]|uniref:leucine-rich repeat-containing protein 49-like isoform X2 n=1 Tax=Oscarella lobularis TaxID=121494 RepID=UPI003313568A
MEWSPYHIGKDGSDGREQYQSSKPPRSHRSPTRRSLALAGPHAYVQPRQSVTGIRSLPIAPLQGSGMTPRDKSVERRDASTKSHEEVDPRQRHHEFIQKRLSSTSTYTSNAYSTGKGDKVVFAESPSVPGVPVVYRLPEDKQENPEILNLSRRQLSVCPILEGEIQLKLLNFQHNMITRIQHLSCLRNLIFLDLYDNLIEEISGLSSLTSLRILLLGKNRISKISNLDKLVKLDVLDLQSNKIRFIENLVQLPLLRIVDLSGNQIASMENLAGMDSLEELNLNRNVITEVFDIDTLPKIKKLCLGSNRIQTFDAVRCLSGAPSTLVELTLEPNPLCEDPSYKFLVLESVRSLKLFDAKRVTDDEYRVASIVLKKTEEKKREEERMDALKERRRVAISNAERKWKAQQSRGAFWSKPRRQERPNSGKGSQGNSRPSSASGQRPPRPVTQPASRSQSQIGNREGSLFYFTELEGNRLSFYGIESLQDLEKNWGSQAVAGVTTIAFNFVYFDDIASNLYKIRARFPGLANLVFQNTGLESFQQLNALNCLRRLESIVIEPEGNPVVEFQLWKSYLLFRLSHLGIRQINGQEVTASEVVSAEKLFGNLSHISTAKLPQSRLLSLLNDARRKQVLHAASIDGGNDASSRRWSLISAELKRSHGPSVEAIGKAGLQYHHSETSQKKTQTFNEYSELAEKAITKLKSDSLLINKLRQRFEQQWPQMVKKMTDSALNDMRSLHAYMQHSLNSVSTMH